MKEFIAPAALTILTCATSALADEEVYPGTPGSCIDMVVFGIEGVDVESCVPILNQLIDEGTLIPEVHSQIADYLGINETPASPSQPPTELVSYGHVSVAAWPETVYSVEGPNIQETLEYISQITVPSRTMYYIGGASAPVDISYNLNGCLLSYTERFMCGDDVFEMVQHGFDLTQTNLNRASLYQGRAQLQATNGNYFPKRRTTFGQCDGRRMTLSQTFDPPQVREDYDLFLIFEPMIRDQRSDYSEQMQRALLQLSRICGAGQETLLFD